MFGDISTAEVNPLYSIVDRESFEDRAAMAHTVATVKDDARRLAPSIQTQHGLLLEEDFRRAKLLEKDVRRLHPITVWI